MQSNAQVQQVSVNPITVISAVITAAGAMAITAANTSNELLSVNGRSLINLSNAGEKLTSAVDERAGILGTALINDGDLAAREHEIKSRMRLRALERQEEDEKRASRKPVVKKPSSSRKPGRPAGSKSPTSASRKPIKVSK
jgi:hypothetical protein